MPAPKELSGWIKKYMKAIEEGRIDANQILKIENAIRGMNDTNFLKLSSITRMINLAKRTFSVIKFKPCNDCKYFKFDFCEYPEDLFEHYETLDDFSYDLAKKNCKLKEIKKKRE